MLFAYKAKSKDGKVYQGAMEALDRFALAKELRSRGSTPLSIKGKGRSINLDYFFRSILQRVSTSEKIIFAKNLQGMLRAGLPLARSLSVLEKQTKNKALKKILESLITDINSGSTLSSALAKFPRVFSKLFVSMVHAGEESGNIAGALTDVSANLEKAHALTRKVQGALIYPGIILSAMVVIGILMFAFVVPTLASTFEGLGVKLPTSTRFLIAVGNFFSEHLLLSFLLVIAGAFALFALFRAKFMAKYIDFFVLHFPVVGNLAKELNTARTTRTIASLLSAGVSITRSIEVSEDVVQNIYYKKVLRDAREAVEKGAPFSAVFAENPTLYPVMMSEMAEVGEETGKLADMLSQIALFYEEQIENKTRNLSTIIEPVLMIVIGVGVGFFAISMISPLYSVLSEIK